MSALKRPRPGTKIERAIDFIRRRSGARQVEIGAHIDALPSNVRVMLRPYVDSGLLVTCRVQVPGTPPQTEYRMAAGGRKPDAAVIAQAEEAARKGVVEPEDDADIIAPIEAKRVEGEVQVRGAQARPKPDAASIAPKSVEATAFHCALLLDGTLRIHSAAGALVLNKRDTETLLRFLGSPIRLSEGA